MKNTQMLKLIWMFASIASAGPRLLSAQVQGNWTPTAADCQAATDSLAAGSRNVTVWAYLSQCNGQGAVSLAAGITRARLESDTTYLDGLLATARTMQDSTILNAALDIALDVGAALPARVMAINLLLAEYTPTHEFLSSGGWAELLSAPRGRNCGLSSVSDGDYTYTSGMPTNLAQRIADAADSITSRSSDSQVIRDLAACVRRALSTVVPTTVPASSLQFAYVCGNKFRVTNTGAKPAQLTYDVVGQSGSFGLLVPANGAAGFITEKAGQVRLYQAGQLLTTLANSNVPCP